MSKTTNKLTPEVRRREVLARARSSYRLRAEPEAGLVLLFGHDGLYIKYKS